MVIKSPFPDEELPRVPIALYAMERMKHFGDSVALIDPHNDKTLTFNQLREGAIEFAMKLRSIGVQKGDMVGLVVDFHPDSYPIVLGINLCKAVLAAGNINAKTRDIAKQLIQIGAKFCICSNFQLKQELKNELKSVRIYDLEDFKTVVVKKDKKVMEGIFSSEGVDIDEDPYFICFTSGTTGQPKAMTITSANLFPNTLVPKTTLKMIPGDCMLTVCKQLHLLGLVTFLSFLCNGLKHVITTSLSPNLFDLCLKRYSVNGILLSDYTTFTALLDEADTNGNTSLRFLLTTGAPTPAKLLQRASEKWKVVVSSTWGSSECGWATCTTSKTTPYNGVGELCPNFQLKVIDTETGVELGAGQVGEICVKSPCVFKGYLNNKEATEAVKDKLGWFHTGDLGRYDDKGIVYIVDRIKNIIKSLGNMAVFPAQLEAALLAHPGVREAVVVGITHPIYNEAAKAFVVRKDPSLTEEELIRFYNEQVAEYQQLFGGLQFIDEIPKTGLGKPLKRALVQIPP